MRLIVDMAPGRNVYVELGAGGDTFGASSPALVGSGPTGMVAADFNKDGHLDLAVANSSRSRGPQRPLRLCSGKGDGTFTVGATLQAGTGPSAVVASDFNCDGMLDLVVTNSGSNNVSVFSGNGDGTFGTAVPFPAGTGPGAPAIGDFDGDGWLDVIVTNYEGDTLTLLRNQ